MANKHKRPQKKKNFVKINSDVAMNSFHSGAGFHDPRPRRERQRGQGKRKAINESWSDD